MEANNKKTYSLIFERKIKEGFDVAIVKGNLKRFFKNNTDFVEKLFLNDTTILKTNLSKAQAEKYKTALESAGAQCSIIENIENTQLKKPNREKEDFVSHKVDDLITVSKFLVRVISFNQKMIWVLLIFVVLSIVLWGKLYFDNPQVSGLSIFPYKSKV